MFRAGCVQLESRRFDVLIIDEAGQATEPDCWIPILKAEKVILVTKKNLQKQFFRGLFPFFSIFIVWRSLTAATNCHVDFG